MSIILAIFLCASSLFLRSDAVAVGASSAPPSEEPSSTTPAQGTHPQDDNVRQARNLDNELNKGNDGMEEMFLKKLNNKCNNRKDISSCVMLKTITYMNRLLKKASLEISDSIEITQTSPVSAEGELNKENLKADESSRGYTEESIFTELITEKLWNFVKSRSLKWKLLPEAAVVLSTTSDDKGYLNLGVALRSSEGVEEGRGKMKNMGPIIAAGIMKIGMLKVLAFKALALLVGKALLVSKLAFLLASIIGLRKLFSQQRHVTYEVVAHPHHSHAAVESHGHGDSYSSGWGRSGDAQNLAYRGHLQK